MKFVNQEYLEHAGHFDEHSYVVKEFNVEAIALAETLNEDALDCHEEDVESLKTVDDYLDGLRDNLPDDLAEWEHTIRLVGAYAGEIIRNRANRRFHWVGYYDCVEELPEADDLFPHALTHRFAVLISEGGAVLSPHHQVLEFLREGREHSLREYVARACDAPPEEPDDKLPAVREAEDAEVEEVVAAMGEELDPDDLAGRHRLRAELFHSNGNPGRALEELDEALRVDPCCAEIHFDRGNLLSELGDAEQALHHYDKALELAPDESTYYINRGHLLAHQDKNDKALADFDQAVQWDGANALAYYNRGLCLFRMRKFARAVKEFDQAIVLDPDDSEFFEARGDCWIGLRKHKQALADFNRALDMEPESSEALTRRGDCWEEMGKRKKAKADYDLALKMDPNLVEAWLGRASLLMFKQRWKKAITALNSALERNPNSAAAFAHRGLCHAELEKNRKAVADFNQALELDDALDSVHYNRGCRYLAMEQYPRAMQDLNEALRRDPKDAEAYWSRGLCWERQGKPAKAVEDFNQAVQWNSHEPLLFIERGKTLEDMGQYVPAMEDYRQALILDDQLAVAHNNVAWIMAAAPIARLRDPQSAVKHSRQACELTDWEEFYTLDTLATACAAAGDFRDAIKYQSQAMKWGSKEECKEGRTRLRLYRQGRPYVL
ncbi:MAG: tetratricopeptide repeat protein, partial [Planctomycetales bacterium]